MPVSERVRRWTSRVRNRHDLERLSDFDEAWALPLVLAALSPIALSLAGVRGGVALAINVVAWLVFVVDLAVHVRLIRGYLHTPLGLFDLAVVVATAPWFFIPGFESSSFLLVARLARLARVFFVSAAARRVLQRLGRVTIVAVTVLVVCTVIVYDAEHGTNPEFDSFSDAMWWGIVTLTTVGYGDIVPETSTGRVAAAALMIMGISLLGLLAGTLASFFRLAPQDTRRQPRQPDPPAGAPAEPALEDAPGLAEQITALRVQLRELERRLPNPSAPPDET